MDTRTAAPATVGDILREEFITPDMHTLYDLAANIEMDVDQLAQTLSNEHQLSDAEADRLGEYLGTGGEFWKNLRDGHLRWKNRTKNVG